MSEPITNLEDAVRELGALPMPIGTAPVDPIAAGRQLDLLELMDDRAASVVSPVLAAVLDEAEHLQARLTGLEEQRDRYRAQLVVLRNDALNMRGALAPNGQDRRVPFPLGETLAPAVEWLIARVAELEAASRVDNEALDAAAEALRDRSEGEHYAVVHHDYRLGHDLPETGGAR